MEMPAQDPIGQIRINPSQTTPVKCTCGCETFRDAMQFRKASRILVASDHDEYFVVPVMICVKCHETHEELTTAMRRQSSRR